ncbi:fructose-6-phosphate aldolase [Dialister micraerophilus]|uniref:Probable transaldolase n=1 Tax=Dialister micraerophilus DSM 19965 TaxID=888062 RepID=F2BXD6_9FIRM|nr:fructose-6-phosphate aldolase [Dialister micraerophilus]EGF13566.1 fructose-6-phosphate aldolase 2 [Dialister micraerophilus DSM 19965]
MKFFIDTADINLIRSAVELGFISGVTTNPSLIAKEGVNFHERIKEISEIVDGPISAEVLSDDEEGMMKEALELSAIHKNIVIKIPMTENGMKVVSALKKKGIKTNVTLVFSANQALFAARVGASYVSPFVGRIEDIGWDGVELISKISEIFNFHDIDTEIIAASIRKPLHLEQCALAGADIATVPYKVLIDALYHPLTEKGIKKFQEDYKKIRIHD